MWVRAVAAANRFGPFVLAAILSARVWSYTVDDAYISLRYARNLALGRGLVFNPGEWVEGYTNFLWTVVLAVPHALGVDAVLAAKLLGFAAVVATVEGVGRLERVAAPGRALGLAPWFLASSLPFVGHGVFGLETAAYAALVVWGVVRMAAELQSPERRPWGSGTLFGIAATVRPDAPLWAGLAFAVLPAHPWSRDNLVRALAAAAPLLLLTAFRLAVYGHPVPNTLPAKTGDAMAQIVGGSVYLTEYLTWLGPVAGLVGFGGVVALGRPSRLRVYAALAVACWTGYVVLVGGDWMIAWRFLAPAEPLLFALAAAGLADVWHRWGRSGRAVVVGACLLGVAGRVGSTRDLAARVDVEDSNWKRMLDAPVAWLQQAPPGEVAFADLGYVGYVTDRPIFDLLGLMAPEIARLEGGYTRKDGRGLVEAVVRRRPTYVFLLSLGRDCHHPIHEGMRAIYEQPDRIFQRNYVVAAVVPWYGDMVGCFWEHAHADAPRRMRQLFDFEAPSDLLEWSLEGEAPVVAFGPIPGQAPVAGVHGAGHLSTVLPGRGDAARGRAVSPSFILDRDVLAWRVGGGFVAGVAVMLEVDGQVVRRASGRNTEGLDAIFMDVRPWRGRSARIVVEDAATGPWGHVLLDDVRSFDLPGLPPPAPPGDPDGD
ncbi:MAG: hypothetical protein D6705_14085 [Deltaproteobacteria bacterium]|nr:MAG: hypothetical protein D6705_14085 [Deltaproteobacteria bacterium]